MGWTATTFLSDCCSQTGLRRLARVWGSEFLARFFCSLLAVTGVSFAQGTLPSWALWMGKGLAATTFNSATPTKSARILLTNCGLSWQHVTAICFHFLMIQVPRPSRPRSRQRRTVPWGPAFRRDHGFLPKKRMKRKMKRRKGYCTDLSAILMVLSLILYRCFRSKMGLAKWSACLVVEAVSHALPH